MRTIYGSGVLTQDGMRWIVWLVLAHVLVVGQADAERRFALVIGANPGWSQDRPLRYAERDAERVRDVLVSLGGFAPDRVELLRDPSTSEVRASLRKLAASARDDQADDTLVFVYYSGHADDVHLHLKGDPLTHRELQDTLRALPSTIRLGVIDACKSGAVTHKGGRRAHEFAVDFVSPKLSGMVLLSSSGADELSQESRSLQGSVFTHHLVSGLRGGADDNNDHQVTIGEAYAYAYARTHADTAIGAVTQRPAFRYELTGQGELVMTRLKVARTATVVVPKGPPQKYVVLDMLEWRLIAEATSSRDRDVMLAVAPGTYRVKRLLEDRIEVASLQLADGARANVTEASYQSAPLSAGIVKGDPASLPPYERLEWTRGEALRLLADGQASAALMMFDQVLREVPSDVSAWRGRGRALVRLAEAYQAVQDVVNERRALSDALRADPSLTHDPLFSIWYQRLTELETRAQESSELRAKRMLERARNPRIVKTFGIGFELMSARSILGISGTWVPHRMVFASAGLDFSTPGVDLALRVAPRADRWSPFFGVGLHSSAADLGVEIGGTSGQTMVDDQMYDSEAIWGMHARVEGGAQLVTRSGFTTELGLSMILFESAEGKKTGQLWPVIHLGWLF